MKRLKRDEQRLHRNTSNEDEQQRESVTQEELCLIDGNDEGENECLTLTAPHHVACPFWTHGDITVLYCWALVSPRQLALLQLLPGGDLHGDVHETERGRE